jgi:6-phosphofructokinase 1
MLDPETGRTRVRLVDVDTEYYKIARRYMLRLRKDDFEDPAEIQKYASVAKTSPENFKAQLEYLVKNEPPPLEFDF